VSFVPLTQAASFRGALLNLFSRDHRGQIGDAELDPFLSEGVAGSDVAVDIFAFSLILVIMDCHGSGMVLQLQQS
jgi:hypothetical protein